MFSQIYLK